MFRAVENSVGFPSIEARVGQFWKDQEIYQKSLAARAGRPRFVFYEGPPTANGMPHPGHCLTRAIKDVYPRYRTMRGYYCERKAGWDTHGLPVEVEVCKELGIHSKEEIEAFGIEPFIHKCQESVWRYMQQWVRLTERMGFWVNLDEAYVTYHQSFIESVWWALKNLFDRGLLYQGHKIVWWWAQGGTALSSGEVGQGYREVADPSVFVRFPLLDDAGKITDESLLVWTTTPWTLPSNQFAAVHPDLEYTVVSDAGPKDGASEDHAPLKLVVASALVETIAKKVGRELTAVRTMKGSELIGRRYLPPFDYYYATQGNQTSPPVGSSEEQALAWRVVGAPFVTTDSGSGVVHQAPAFGEVDFQVLLDEQARFEPGRGPQLICAVGPDGRFTAEAPDYAGRWVKDCDRDISRELRSRGLLYHQEQYLHDYPFCWRAEQDPLIQYPRRSWFVRTTQFRDEMLANNAKINWLPEHIKEGRFGNFLESNVDWALSRERYWGTPLPIWVCEATGQMEAVAKYDDLLTKPGVQGTEVWEAAKQARPELNEHLKVHKPYIDAVTYDSPYQAGARMRRVSDVIDCWFDSGAMPFAQWGFPHTGQEQFRNQFPADFISEAIDQTRGWFYSQLAISTLLFGEAATREQQQAGQTNLPHPGYPQPFRNCIVLGLMLGEDGAKMSKSKRNYREPAEIFDKYGADALRWYFFANQAPWTSIRYSERAIKDSIPEFLLRLWNVYSFFVIYANIDGFDPAARLQGEAGGLEPEVLARADGYRPVAERSELDRWILSELHRTTAAVVERMDAYDNFAACGRLNEFVDALSNWYVRRSRDRFWSETESSDTAVTDAKVAVLRAKNDAYWTLYECLVTTTKLVAPFVPFLSESIWQNLAGAAFGDRVQQSVHLCDYPTADTAAIDESLSTRMNLAREISSLGRAARMNAKLKVRQPLAKVEVVLANPSEQAWLEQHAAIIREELNVKLVEFAAKADQYITYNVLPDLKRLGPKIGKRLPAAKKALAEADGGRLLSELQESGKVTLTLADGPLELTSEDLQVRLEAKPGWAAAQGKACVVVLSTEITPELVAEGWAREVTHHLQSLRKTRGLEFTDRVRIALVTPDETLRAALEASREWIAGEVLATELVLHTDAAQTNGVRDDAPVEVEIDGHKLTILLQPAGKPAAAKA